MTELVDEVDEYDALLGRKITKEEAHELRLFHRCVAIYVFDHAYRKLYLQVHQKSNGRFDHSAGGHVQSGEQYDHAAIRELKEELNLDRVLIKISSHYVSVERTRSHIYCVYVCTAPKGWKFIANKEVEKLVTFSPEELFIMIQQKPERFTSGLINTIEELRKKDLLTKVNRVNRL